MDRGKIRRRAIKALLVLFLWMPDSQSISGNCELIQIKNRYSIVKNAEKYIGVREQGKNDGPTVRYFLANVDFPAGYAWCGAFVYTCHKESGVIPEIEPKKFAWSPTWFREDKIIWQGYDKYENIVPGSVFGIYYRSLKRIGHVGIVRSRIGDTIITVEGNTNDHMTREGDGVYSKKRRIKTIKAISLWT